MSDQIERSSVRKGWLIYIAVMLALYALIKIFGEPQNDAPPPSAAGTHQSGPAAH
jgi:hypothetical protein